jgi:hypothetical protein
MLSAEGRLGAAVTGAKLDVESATAGASQKGERLGVAGSASVDAADSSCCTRKHCHACMCQGRVWQVDFCAKRSLNRCYLRQSRRKATENDDSPHRGRDVKRNQGRLRPSTNSGDSHSLHRL